MKRLPPRMSEIPVPDLPITLLVDGNSLSLGLLLHLLRFCLYVKPIFHIIVAAHLSSPIRRSLIFGLVGSTSLVPKSEHITITPKAIKTAKRCIILIKLIRACKMAKRQLITRRSIQTMIFCCPWRRLTRESFCTMISSSLPCIRCLVVSEMKPSR